MISNLLHNAAKFTPEQGAIDLKVETEKDPSGADPAWVRIVVADNGAGISAGLLPEMFNLFVQADTTQGRSRGRARHWPDAGPDLRRDARRHGDRRERRAGAGKPVHGAFAAAAA